MKKHDTHGSNEEEWVGFDLDGTLAKYDGWKGYALPSPSDKARKAVLGMVKKLEKKAALSYHDRLLRVIMRRNPGFTRKDAEKYISDGSLDRELAKHLS